jgi:hypothetical protein
MIGRIKIGLFVMALVGFVFAFAASSFTRVATAGDKKCETCEQIHAVLAGLRCDKCKTADKQCDHCAEYAKKVFHGCKGCDEGKTCEACEKALKDAKCKFCAAKKFLADHQFCCKKCEKAGKVCEKCEEQRKPILAVACATCDKK